MKKENNVKKMRWIMKNPDSLKWYFLIGALIGAVLLVMVYVLPRCSMDFSDWFT